MAYIDDLVKAWGYGDVELRSIDEALSDGYENVRGGGGTGTGKNRR